MPTSYASLDKVTLTHGCACQRRSWNTPTPLVWVYRCIQMHVSCNLLLFFFRGLCVPLNLGKVLSVAKKLGVLEAKLEEAKKQTQRREDGDKFVEIVEPFLARSKVGSVQGVAVGWVSVQLLSLML